MFVIDAHCDSLTEGSGLVNACNTSKRHPFLQFYAVCVCGGGETPEEQEKKAKAYLSAFSSAWDGVLVRDRASLEQALFSPKSAVLTLEGADAVTSEEKLEEFFEKGVRVIHPTWNAPNHLASSCLVSGTAEDLGFTEKGLAFLSACEKRGVLIDVSHLSDRSFSDLEKAASRPFFASHSNCRALCPHKRNLTDSQIRSLFSQGGFLGLNLYPPFLVPSGEADTEDLFSHLDHALSLGGEDQTGFGFDIDGTGGRYPRDLSLKDSLHDQVIARMIPRYGTELTEKIAGKNAAAFLRRALR